MPEGQYGDIVQYDLKMGKNGDFEGFDMHCGLIASGDRVIESAERRDEIIRHADDTLCFEMLAAGPMTEFACRY